MYDETDLFSTDRDETLREVFTANGIEVLTTESFKSGDADFSAQLTRIKELNPDVIFVSALPPEKPRILIQGRKLGVSVPFIVSSLTDLEVQAAGAAAEGAITFTGWLPTDDTPGNRAFIENYKATFGTEAERLRCVFVCLGLYFSCGYGEGPINRFNLDSRRTRGPQRTSTPFWASSLLTPTGMRFMSRRC